MHQPHRSVTIHMVRAILRVVFHDEITAFDQKRLCATVSTIRPSARSLSASMARGVGFPGRVPTVWSLGRERTVKLGNAPLFSWRIRGQIKALHIGDGPDSVCSCIGRVNMSHQAWAWRP